MGVRSDDAGLTRSAACDPGDDPRVLELVKEYQAELDRGRRPDRVVYLARHPELAPVLTEYFDGLDLLRKGAKDLTGSGPRPARLDTGLTPGDRLGEFEIIREIGRGGMGVVYEAWQPSLNRRVAVKVLPAGFGADRTKLRRFAVEAQAAAAVDHPHIVPVYAVGEDRGINYYVMRLVDGVSLDAVVAGISSPTAELRPHDTRPYTHYTPPTACRKRAIARSHNFSTLSTDRPIRSATAGNVSPSRCRRTITSR
jgi:serine/threonine protein kinase